MSRSGQEIVYCSTCSTQVRGTDFEKGRAFKVKDQVFCECCCPEASRGSAGSPPSASRTALKGPSWSSSPHRRRALPRTNHVPEGVLAAVAATAVVVGAVLLLRPSESATVTMVPIVREPAPPPAAAELPLPGALVAEPAPKKESVVEARPPGALIQRKAEETRIPEPPRPEEHPPELRAAPALAAPIPPPVEAFSPAWEAAVAATQGRDYETALAAFRKSPSPFPDAPRDLELLLRASNLQRQIAESLARIPKGQKVILELRQDSGQTRRVEGSVLRVGGGRLVVKSESGVDEVEVGELLPSSLVGILQAGGSSPDTLACALWSLLEGELGAALKILGDRHGSIPDRYWAYGRKISEVQRQANPARALYADALRDLGFFATASRGVAKVQALLRDHALDPFVLRNKASLIDRSQGARDYFLLAEDLRVAGTLRAAKGGKAETFWTSEEDLDVARSRENYVEAVFSTVPDAAYRGWVLAGGCCQETFEFSCQGSDLLAGKGAKEPAEPGSALVVPVKPWVSSLKKTHSGHNGPKHPARWEWISLPLPRFGKSGEQRLRVLFEQKGFSVAGLCISASRTGPPAEAELKEFIRSRGERPKIERFQPPKVVTLLACRFDGSDRRLLGTIDKGSLYGVTEYNQCFSGLERPEPFTVPAQGELRATYFLSRPTRLSFRLRIQRGASLTVPHDVLVEHPAVGVATEIRIPFSEFRAINQPGTPAVAPGDQTTMIYIFGEAIDCGLRLDALSLVEIRPPEK
jgi:hypothetical protein